MRFKVLVMQSTYYRYLEEYSIQSPVRTEPTQELNTISSSLATCSLHRIFQVAFFLG